jgi:F0F1-type ATP synthase assembly protein I
MAGLIAVMPFTGAIVLVWLYWDNPGNFELMASYTKAALLGILPSILFFVVAYICFRKHLGLWLVLGVSFAAWLLVAVVHFWLLHE